MANENEHEKRNTLAGNAAAMRAALENIAGYAETARCHTEDAHVLGYLEQIEKWAKEALSAPARNCDLYETANNSRKAFNEWLKHNSPMSFGGWLLAPAAERKGESDGK